MKLLFALALVACGGQAEPVDAGAPETEAAAPVFTSCAVLPTGQEYACTELGVNCDTCPNSCFVDRGSPMDGGPSGSGVCQ